MRQVLCVTVVGLALAACSPFTAGRLKSGGKTRTFHYLVPSKGTAPFPLVVALHGRGGNGKGQDKLSHVLRLVEGQGVALVLPDGVSRSWADARDAGPAAEQGVDDVAFLSALIDEMVAKHQADPKRVYVMGMSNGGFMTTTLVCRIPEKIAAAASVTGAVSANLSQACSPARPVPIAFFMGDEDPLVPVDGGEVAGDKGEVLSAVAGAAFFAQQNLCAAEPQRVELPDGDPKDGTRVDLLTWPGCSGGAEVRLYLVKGGGHTWPAGRQYLPQALIGRTSRDLDATTEAWAFFQRFSLP